MKICRFCTSLKINLHILAPKLKRMEENKGGQVSGDEIDLREVFKAIGQFFLNVWDFLIALIVQFRRTTINHYKLILIVTLISVLFGVWQYYRIRPFYKTSMILQSGYLNSKLLENIIDNLNQLPNTNGNSGFVETLRVAPEVAQNIIRFEAEPFITEEEVLELEKLKIKFENANISSDIAGPVLEQLTYYNRNAFEVTVFVYEPNLIGGLDSLLFNYIKSNVFVNKRIQAGRKELSERLKKLKEEQPKLDSLKTILFTYLKALSTSRREGSDNIFIGDENAIDPLSVFQKDLLHNDQVLSIEKQLFLQSDFEMIDRFTPYYKPESASISDLVRFHFSSGVILSYLIIFLLAINKWLSRKEDEIIN